MTIEIIQFLHYHTLTNRAEIMTELTEVPFPFSVKKHFCSLVGLRLTVAQFFANFQFSLDMSASKMCQCPWVRPPIRSMTFSSFKWPNTLYTLVCPIVNSLPIDS